MLRATPVVVTLRAAGVALVLDVAGPLLPRVLHWGTDLGPDVDSLDLATDPAVTHSALDEAGPLTLLPAEGDGWAGTPGLEVARAGRGGPLRLRLVEPVTVDGNGLSVLADDAAAGVQVRLRLDLDVFGVLTQQVSVVNTGADELDLLALHQLFPLPERAVAGLDLTGRWIRERSPQRFDVQHGTHLRASRRGRTGHDATLLLTAGTAGFGFRRGEVWATHVAWSGNHVHLVERLPEGAGRHGSVLGGGELLGPAEVRLAPGEAHTAPLVFFVYSADGLDGLSGRLHRYQRARPAYPSAPRPVVLNTWEAVYFDHDLDRLSALARTAASIGVERFVLDDGWFGGRRDDTRGLGDWTVSDEQWPDGLAPLFDTVRGLGMQVGLWVEPEMVNPDSDLVRAHPDWVLGPLDVRPWRRQLSLDLTNPDAWAHLLARLDALVTENGIDFLKWDHNRDLHEAVSDGRPAIHRQTAAVYALLDELLARHPGLEIESCASGGARVDLGILARTHRVWTSDCNDALERTDIQLWTTLLLPPELMGTHVGPPVAHTTHRHVDLAMRCATALFGHAGLEWDITTCDRTELDQLRAWIALHKSLRPLLHSGDVVRADVDEPGERLHGVVAADGAAAVFAFVQLTTGSSTRPGIRPLPGLDPARRYRVVLPAGIPAPRMLQAAEPGWMALARAAGFVTTGAVLTRAGLTMPVLLPGQALVLVLTAV
ncbi:alpha-galactosidase [Pengzhenrongella phosphoraccumulans]|uniref:alpha-galactosidase n=1 Tax=Pengzhenrongella phosphoraccumulans TaxID=3114394 RepID=UPI003890550D